MSATPAGRFPGRGSFIAGSIVLICFGAVHAMAVVRDFSAPKTGAAADLLAAEKHYTDSLGPFTFSAWGLVVILSVSYTVLLLSAGIANLSVLAAAHAGGRLRGLTLINILTTAALGGVSAVCRFPPPMVFAFAAMLCFAVSLVRQKGSENA